MKPKHSHLNLAIELATKLNDATNLKLYQSYTSSYTEEALRTILVEVLSVPAWRIRKSRAALFTYLVQRYGNTYANRSRN